MTRSSTSTEVEQAYDVSPWPDHSDKKTGLESVAACRHSRMSSSTANRSLAESAGSQERDFFNSTRVVPARLALSLQTAVPALPTAGLTD